MMKKPVEGVLVVEDSNMFARTITAKIEKDLGFNTRVAASFEETREVFRDDDSNFYAAVLDLVLPDAQYGEVVDYVLDKKIPVVVLTSEFSDDIRDELISRNIVDYIVKEGPQCLDHLVNILLRLYKNRTTKVLVVDDSGFSRKTIKDLLARHRFEIIEAQNGKEALAQLDDHPDVKVVITDYNMPVMDGFELVTEIRKTYSMDKMVVIGVSGHGGSVLSAKFIKKGANDFIVKPFSNEEFFWRINQNLQMMDYIESIRNAAIKDHLTGLYNRRYFFDIGQKLFANAQRKSFDIVVGMLDIDNFKRINDGYGHAIGDKVLQHTSKIIMNHFRESDVVARIGGEEFCIMAPNMKSAHGIVHFERLRKAIEDTPLIMDGGQVGVTISVGITSTMFASLEETIHHTDQLLYQAKSKGRNQVISG